MDTYTLVRPEHLNHHGFLFGGQLLKWVDELAWLCASRGFPGVTLVTVGMDKIQFRYRVTSGSILRFQIELVRQGETSLTYAVDVYADAPGTHIEEHVFNTLISFVNIDDNGKKQSISSVSNA